MTRQEFILRRAGEAGPLARLRGTLHPGHLLHLGEAGALERTELPFDARDHLVGDVLLAELQPASHAITPVQFSKVYADPAWEPGVASLVTRTAARIRATAGRVREVIAALERASGSNNQQAAFADAELLHQKLVEQGTAVACARPTPAAPPPTLPAVASPPQAGRPVQANLARRHSRDYVAPVEFFHPGHPDAPRVTKMCRLDNGADEVFLVSPGLVSALGLESRGTVNIGDANGGERAFSAVTIGWSVGGVAETRRAVVHPQVRQVSMGYDVLAPKEIQSICEEKGIIERRAR